MCRTSAVPWGGSGKRFSQTLEILTFESRKGYGSRPALVSQGRDRAHRFMLAKLRGRLPCNFGRPLHARAPSRTQLLGADSALKSSGRTARTGRARLQEACPERSRRVPLGARFDNPRRRSGKRGRVAYPFARILVCVIYAYGAPSLRPRSEQALAFSCRDSGAAT